VAGEIQPAVRQKRCAFLPKGRKEGMKKETQ
jgi:hypothetical protein